jgi:hypothetical protein
MKELNRLRRQFPNVKSVDQLPPEQRMVFAKVNQLLIQLLE